MSTRVLRIPVQVTRERRKCAGCGHPTVVRVDGKPGHWSCVAPPGATADFPDLTAKTADSNLRLLHDLETTYAPKRKVEGKMCGPWWRPPIPEVADLVRAPAFSWRRPYDGPTVTLDRSGAWISAASSVDVAHGALEHTGPGYTGRPGFYKVTVYPWPEESRLPHPLGPGALDHETLWVNQPRAALLHDLADQGRWPDSEPLDSYTGDKVRLDKWATHVNTLRAATIKKYGRDSDQYDAVKIAFSQAIALMIGTREPGKGRTWPNSGTHRIDWSYAVQDLSAVMMWRWADDCDDVAPEASVVAIQNADELVLPAEALPLVTTRMRSRGRPPLKLDPTGLTLGTFKIKDAA